MQRIEDADVCLAHAPGELDFMPLSEPLVDVEASVARLLDLGRIGDAEAWRWLNAARDIYFADRTPEAMLDRAGLPAELAADYRRHRVGVKACDALAVVERLKALPAGRREPPVDWTFRPSHPWRAYLASLPGTHPA